MFRGSVPFFNKMFYFDICIDAAVGNNMVRSLYLFPSFVQWELLAKLQCGITTRILALIQFTSLTQISSVFHRSVCVCCHFKRCYIHRIIQCITLGDCFFGIIHWTFVMLLYLSIVPFFCWIVFQRYTHAIVSFSIHMFEYIWSVFLQNKLKSSIAES